MSFFGRTENIYVFMTYLVHHFHLDSSQKSKSAGTLSI